MRVIKKNGSTVYISKCLDCNSIVRTQSGQLKKASGKCRSCSQKKRKYQAAYSSILANEKSRGISVDLTYDQFIKLAEVPDCFYCGELLYRTEKRGIKNYRAYLLDRKDNSLGYSLKNCVPCCWRCNQTKGDRFSHKDFMKMMLSIRTPRVNPEVGLRQNFLFLNDFFD